MKKSNKQVGRIVWNADNTVLGSKRLHVYLCDCLSGRVVKVIWH